MNNDSNINQAKGPADAPVGTTGLVGSSRLAAAGPVAFSLGLARDLAAESALVYSVSQITGRTTGAAARINYSAELGAVIISFKGSSTVRDFIQDAKFVREPLVWPMNEYQQPLAEVHRGFLEDFESIAEELTGHARSMVNSLPGTPVYITGHSLGGALAISCALEFGRQGIPVTSVYTFGQPRVGNKGFAELYETSSNLQEVTFRVVNENDIVPRTPGVLMGYRHCGNLALILPWNDLVVNPHWLTKLLSDGDGLYQAYCTRKDVLITDHFIAKYQAALAALEP